MQSGAAKILCDASASVMHPMHATSALESGHAPGVQRTTMSAATTNLCPCGSGLRPARCCALQQGAVPPAEATRHLVPLVERAIQAYQQGAKDTADRLCLDVLEQIGR